MIKMALTKTMRRREESGRWGVRRERRRRKKKRRARENGSEDVPKCPVVTGIRQV